MTSDLQQRHSIDGSLIRNTIRTRHLRRYDYRLVR